MEQAADEEETCDNKNVVGFKKPVLIGKIGRFPRKVTTIKSQEKEQQTPKASLESTENLTDQSSSDISLSAGYEDDKPKPSTVVPYKEPDWGGLPECSGKKYSFDVLKAGTIIETVDLMGKSYWVFGRIENCDLCMQHPTISRCHAVLQYRNETTNNEEIGFYIYDMDSTHGTFLNKKRLLPKTYTRVKVGHMLKFGCSTRTYILNGPEEDAEAESELTVTELKQKRIDDARKMEELALQEERDREERRRKEEEAGVDWGMGHDADEEGDLSENPFAQSNNEELYIEDPKKALRGFMEREGFDLEYDCTEQGMGQFLCKVMLPLDDQNGRPIYAEVLHKGKKKEAVVQCALEACRILDRHGLLRQASHESRKRKSKDWEANDYYDSDEDTFLDRTGTIEKKRENRMKSKKTQEVETYQSLVEKEKKLSTLIVNIEKQLSEGSRKEEPQQSSIDEEDSLDSYMKGLKESKLDKQMISRLKSELLKLKKDHAQVVKLANLAKPADLPALVPQNVAGDAGNKNKLLPLFGKRPKAKFPKPLPSKTTDLKQSDQTELKEVEEEDDDEEGEDSKSKKIENSNASKLERLRVPAAIAVCDAGNILSFKNEVNDFKLDEQVFCFQKKINSIIQTIKTVISVETQLKKYWNSVNSEWNKLQILLSDIKENGSHSAQDFQQKVSSELDRLAKAFDEMLDKKERSSLSNVQKNRNKKIDFNRKSSKPTENPPKEDNKQEQTKEYSSSKDYEMWVPPSNQTGDGRTSLNDKLGY